MSKKDFKNPSMAFISDETIAKVDGEPEEIAKAKKPAGKPKSTTEVKASASRSASEKRKRVIVEVPEDLDISTEFMEKKTKRVQLLMQPSVYNYMKREADLKDISVNEAIARVLREYIAEREK